MNQIFQDSVELALNTQILVPLALDCRHLKQAYIDVMDVKGDEEKIEDCITQDTFNLINRKVIKILVDSLDILKQHLFIGWNVSPKYILELVFEFIDEQTVNWVQPKFFCSRMQEVKALIQMYYKKCHDNAFELGEALVAELCDDYLGNQELEDQLNELLESQEKSWAYDMFEFAYLEVEITLPLLNKMQEIFGAIVEDFYSYIVDVAQNANEKMCKLNELLDKYNTLANSENYKYMQREISVKIIQYGDQTVIGKSFNVNPAKEEKIAKQAIRYFYEILDNHIHRKWIHIKKHINLEELVNSSDFTIIRPLPQNFQIIHTADDLHLMELCAEIFVNKAQKIQKHDVKGYKITITYNSQQYEYIINLSYHYLMFHKNFNGWEPFEDEINLNILLVKFLNQNFEYLHQGHPEFKKRVSSEKSIDKTTDDIQEFKNTVFKFKKFSAPKKPIRYGTRARVIGAKALGMGLGCLIVDCLDDEIPWEDKMKNAGYTVVSFGVLAVLAARLPVIGIIIQQVILAFAIKSVLANKVISDEQTAKNLGHLGLVITVGIGMTIAGSLMFPVAIWGAFFGGLLGGLSMGLYQKYMIPYCMENLVQMMDKASQLIRKNGVVRYKPFALKKLQFDQKFFETKKPKNLSDDEFFTLLMFCLSNEVKLISVVYYEKQKEKLIKNKATEIQLADLLQRQCQIEVQLKVWNNIKDYLKQHNVSLVDNVVVCAEFVDGMLSNFKVQ